MDLSFIALLLVGFALGLIVFIVARYNPNEVYKRQYESRWKAVLRQDNYNMKVIQADALLDKALQQNHVKGSTMGERLRNSNHLFKRQQYDAIWTAHKLRNTVAHDSKETLHAKEAKRALTAYKKALQAVGVLQ